MKVIDNLISELCPTGVAYKRIDELCEISRGRVISKDYINDNTGDYPVYSSQTENNGVLGCISTYDYEGEYITWTTDGANAGSVFYRNGKFSVTNVCGLLKNTSIEIKTRFLAYALEYEAPKYVNKGMGNPKLMSNVMARVKVPIPPLKIQARIIEILDTFNSLSLELSSELELRKKQYENFAYNLLIKNNPSNRVRLSDVCSIEKGKTAIQKATPGKYPLVVTTTERKTNDSFQFDTSAVCIPLVSSRGHGVASLNHVYYQEGKFALGNILCAVVPHNEKVVNAKYLYYYFECTKDYTLVPLMKGGANVSMHIPDIAGVQIPLPSIEDQKAIIETLEVFDEYCTKLLPKEIESRKLQYVYYRDKLLTFSE